MSAAHWDARYRSDPESLSWYEAVPTTSLAFVDALDVGPAAGVIDVGGGGSCLAALLAERGFEDLTVLDIASVALETARRRMGDAATSVSWKVADVRTWQPTRRWDLWHDRAVFHFMVDPEDRSGYLAALSSGLAPGGAVVLATFASDGPGWCSGLPVERYDIDDLTTVLSAIGAFDVVAARRELHVTPDDVRQPFTWIAARRSS